MFGSRDQARDSLALLWYVAGAPLIGAAAGGAASAIWIRPNLRGWMAEVVTVLAAAAGLLLGGMLGSCAPLWMSRAARARPATRRRLALATTTAAFVVAFAAVATPLPIRLQLLVAVTAVGVSTVAWCRSRFPSFLVRGRASDSPEKDDPHGRTANIG